MRLTSLSLHIFIKSSPQGYLNLYRMTVEYSVAYGFFSIALQNILIQNERALINLISYVKIHWDEKGLTDIHSYSLRFLRLDVSDQQEQRSLCQNDTQIHVYIGIQSLIFLYRKGLPTEERKVFSQRKKPNYDVKSSREIFNDDFYFK